MSAYTPSPPWTLTCPACQWRVIVHARGAHGNDPGSGVEAHGIMQRHWREFHPDACPACLQEGEHDQWCPVRP